jgi:hypothetical protein
VDPHCDQQLLRGFLPYQRQWGSCKVRGGLAKFWYAAAKALGFRIATIRCPDPLLVRQVASLCKGVKSLAPPPGWLRCPRRLPDIAFTDLVGIPLGPDSVEYWRAWGAPHLFFCHGVDNGLSLVGAFIPPDPDLAALDGNLTAAIPTPPQGWAARSVCLSHRETGGSTSGCWTFVVWYPPGFPWVELLVWEPQGGAPLLCCINNRVQALPFHGTRHSGVAGERVVREGGLVLDFGLFPASDPKTRVLLESSASPSGYGLHSLLARELGDLWDVPICFLDSLLELEVTGLMADICKSPPSKLLHTGVNLLLTSAFRGGLEGREAQEGGTAGLVPGPRPCSDAGFGLTQAYERKHPPETKMTMEDFAAEEEVIKGDSQKADNAAVPDNLWLRAFVLGYGNSGCLGRHLGALGCTKGTAGFLGGPTPPMGWQGALPGLHCFALRY